MFKQNLWPCNLEWGQKSELINAEIFWRNDYEYAACHEIEGKRQKF